MRTALMFAAALAFLPNKVSAGCTLFELPNPDYCTKCGEILIQYYNGNGNGNEDDGTEKCDWAAHLCLVGDGACTEDIATEKTKELSESTGSWQKISIQGQDAEGNPVHVPCLQRDGVLSVFPAENCHNVYSIKRYPNPECVYFSVDWTKTSIERADWISTYSTGKLTELTIPDEFHTLYGKDDFFAKYKDLRLLNLNKVTHVEGMKNVGYLDSWRQITYLTDDPNYWQIEFVAPNLKTVVGDGFFKAPYRAPLDFNAPKLETIDGAHAFSGVGTFFADNAIHLPSLKSLGDDAFVSTSIVDFSAQNLLSVGARSFKDSVHLITFDAPKLTEANIGEDAFQGSVLIQDNTLSINDNFDIILATNGRCFLTQQGSTLVRCETCPTDRIDLPTTLTTIGNSAFEGCTELKTVNGMAGVTSIGSLAFKGCTKLQALTNTANDFDPDIAEFNPGVPYIQLAPRSIGAHAFEGCSKLSYFNVKTSSDRLYVGSSAFKGCTTLAEFKADCPMEKILTGTFSGCAELTTVEVKTVQRIMPGAFPGCNKFVTLTTGGPAAANLARLATGLDATDAIDVETFVGNAISASAGGLQAVQRAYASAAESGC